MTKTTPGAMKHSEGPWRIEYDGGDKHIRSASGESLMCDAQFYPWVPSNNADWNLIAACPAMLEALQAVVEGRIDHLRPNLFGCNECRQSAKLRAQIPHRELCHVGKCEAAISAATGEGQIG